jgi:hypothetical protein
VVEGDIGTFSTWLEDAGIPARVIDELMGHQASGRAGRHPSSAIGTHYRHTNPEMAARVVTAVEERLPVVLATAEAALDQQPGNVDSVGSATLRHCWQIAGERRSERGWEMRNAWWS